MVSDSIRAISQVKKEETKKKYEGTYQVDSISDLVPYGSDKAAYEKRVLEIIDKMKGSATRKYYIATFPFLIREIHWYMTLFIVRAMKRVLNFSNRLLGKHLAINRQPRIDMVKKIN